MIGGTDPLGEAGRWLDANLGGSPVPALLVVIGLGQGHLLDLLETSAPLTCVLAFEPDPAAATIFLARRDWTAWFDSRRLIYLRDPDYVGADEAWRIFPTFSDAHVLLIHPSIEQQASEAAVRALRVFKRILFGVRANATARRRFAPGYLLNSIRNLPAIAAGRDVRALKDFYHGVPGVIVGAGPSLDGAIEGLRAVAGRVPLISTDTALRPLLHAGISPAIVVGLDPGEANGRHFLSLPDCRDTWLVCESALDPRAIEPFDDRTFWFRISTHHPWPWFNELGIEVGRLNVWGSVLTAAFQVAVLAGCDPIVLVGADLAFTSGQPYCRGTAYEFEWAFCTALGIDLASVWQAHMTRAEPTRVPDLHGVETTTTPALQAFKDWMVSTAKSSGRRVMNASGGGILFGDGVEQSSLSDALSGTLANPPSLTTIASVRPSRVAPADLANHVHALRRTVEAGTPTTSHVARWEQFCGAGFDLAAIGAALDAAARRLESSERQLYDERPVVIPWAALKGLNSSSRGPLARLPETIAKLRAAMNAAGSTMRSAPTVDAEPSGRAEMMIEGFELLERMCDAGAQSERDWPPPLAEHQGGGIPVSAQWLPDESATWPLRLVEFLLGEAWTVPLPAKRTGFFSSPVLRRDGPGTRLTPVSSAVPRPHATEACLLVAIEWLLCVAAHAHLAPEEIGRLVSWLHGVTAALRHKTGEHANRIGATFVVTAQAGGRSRSIELPWPSDVQALVRVLTGSIQAPDGLMATRGLEIPGLAAVISLRSASTISPGEESSDIGRRVPAYCAPRVLTDEGAPRSIVCYGAGHGAVIAPLHYDQDRNGPESFLVREDGSIERHGAWPRAIIAELPMGSSGGVAWGGSASESNGYVMYRADADGPVTIDALPFLPILGTWWKGRLYWVCHPRGVGSWAPGEEATCALPDLALCSIRGDETALILGAWARDDSGNVLRRLMTHGWTWRVDRLPERVALGPLGTGSSPATIAGWTATAHPQADVVRLESVDGGAMAMTCYYPMTLAWAGRSLLVGTGDGELLIFEGLVERLKHRRSDRGRR